MSLLTLAQHFCERQNLPSPATVYGSTDKQVVQIKALIEEEGNDLSQRGAWQGLINEASHTSLAAEDQGAIATIASNGFRFILNDTIWDRTTLLPVCGPMDSRNWQALKALLSTGPRYLYRIRGGKLLVNPTAVAGESWYFEYVSKNWISDSSGVTFKNYFTADSDLVLLPEELMLMGLRWRWLREKGFDYAELFRIYELQAKDALGRDGGKPVMSMDSGHGGPQPGIFVSPGSWSV
jgi:hypothetical protein